jgi:hypothetical protein
VQEERSDDDGDGDGEQFIATLVGEIHVGGADEYGLRGGHGGRDARTEGGERGSEEVGGEGFSVGIGECGDAR